MKGSPSGGRGVRRRLMRSYLLKYDILKGSTYLCQEGKRVEFLKQWIKGVHKRNEEEWKRVCIGLSWLLRHHAGLEC